MQNKSLLVIMIFFVVLFNSIVYSALNSEMFINGDAHIRVDKDIRITSVKVLEQVNGAYETYNSDYSKNTTSIQVTLPSSESFMVYEVTITNKGDIDYEVTNILEESYSNSNIKYELIDIGKGKVIDAGTIHTFKIKFTTTENNPDNKTTLVLKYDFKEWIPSLYKMVAHKSRSLDTGIDFGVSPTKESSGVYEMNSTKDDEFPVYYYRGIIENNNVSFAGFCWKIVRTTSTGGVKLIYNGVVGSDGSCNNTGTYSQIGTSVFNSSNKSKEDVKYVYNNDNDSEIKKVIDKWYLDNMIEYTDMLEDTVWCSDNRGYNSNENGRYYYYGYDRNVASSNPSIVCSVEDDKFTVAPVNGNGKLTYPIGLLTVDELTLAGSGYNGYINLSYLNNGENWWTFSPAMINGSGIAFNFFVNSNGKSDYFGVHNDYGIRSSISLASNTMISEGNGSVSNPYKLVEDKITKEWTFDSTGGEQEFKVPYDGVYKLEVWGAQGGSYDETYHGGYGAYSTGNIDLKKGTNLYVNVGENGINSCEHNEILNGTYNGGGGNLVKYSSDSWKPQCAGSGGGATHIGLESGELKKLESKNSSIYIVSAGGGASEYFKSPANIYSYCEGGSGGGINGGLGICSKATYVTNNLGQYNYATQSRGGIKLYASVYHNGSFGFGASSSTEGGGGGGGGYYGGAGMPAGTGGGSSYIGNSQLTNKAMYCYNCEESSEESTKTISTTNVSEEAISNYAKKGNGYAKITLITKK